MSVGEPGPLPSFDVRAADNATLRPAIGAVARLTEQARIDTAPDGFVSQMTDSENVAQVRMELPALNFDSYTADDGSFGIDVKALWEALRDVNKSDAVRLEGDAVAETVRVHDVGAGRVVAELDMLDPDEVRKSVDLPDLDWVTTVEVPGDQFGRVIRASDDVGDLITMGVAAKGDTTVAGAGFAFQTHTKGDTDTVVGYPEFEFVERGPPAEAAASHFSTDKVNSLRLAIDRPASTSVRLTFAGSEFPFRMDFEVGDSPGASVTYLLAPRIEGNGDPVDALEEWTVGEHALDSVDFIADMKGGTGKQLFDLFTTFADEYRMLVDETGMEMRAVDSANVALYAVQVQPRFFDSYEPVGGFPDGVIGVGHRIIDSVISKWRKNDDLELASDAERRFISLKHPIFTARIATVDPDSIRQEPQLPPLDLTGRAAGDAEAFVDTAEAVLGQSEVLGFLMSDSRFYLGAVDIDEPFAQRVPSDIVEGRALSVFSAEFVGKAVDVIPQGMGDEVEVRAGFEHPVAIDSEADNGVLQSLFLIAPRIQDDGDLEAGMREAVAGEGLDLSWVDDRDTGPAQFPAVQGFQQEPISERQRIERLTSFPVESRVFLNSRTGELEVADAEEIPAAEGIIDEVLAAVDGDVRTDVLDGGETVADVRFDDEESVAIDLRNVQPDFDFRIQTADGIPMGRLFAEADNWGYVSDADVTPAERQVTVRAAPANGDDEYAIWLGLKPFGRTGEEAEERIFRRGFDTIGNAYAELVDYVTESDIARLVQDAGGEVTTADIDIRDELEAVVDRYVDYDLEGAPGRMSVDVDWYAVIVGRQAIFPDASFRSDINVLKPGTEADGYLVRQHLQLEAKGPGSRRVERSLFRQDVGVADSREGIAHLVQRAFDALDDIDPVYARTERRPFPPRHEASGPPLSEGAVDDWVAFYLPESKNELRNRSRLAGLPVETGDVEGMGTARVAALSNVGIDDMLDYVAVASTSKQNFLGRVISDFPSNVSTTLIAQAGEVWEEVVWPARPEPPGFTEGVEPDVEEPEETFETAALRVPDDEVVIQGLEGPEAAEQDVFGDRIVVAQFTSGLGYALEEDSAVMRVRDEIADVVSEAIGAATRYSEGQVVGAVALTDTVLSGREPVQIRVKERLLEEPVTVVSPFRPLTREARSALQPFDIVDERSIREARRQTEVDVLERPPDDVLEEHELFVDEEPLEVWESDTGQRVEIFETVVIAEGVETTLTPEEAADQVREQDRFSPVEIADDSPFGPVERAEEAPEEEVTPRERAAVDVGPVEDFPVTYPVFVEGEPGARVLTIGGDVPQVALDRFPDEKQSDDPLGAFTSELVGRVSGVLGNLLERVPLGTEIGEITFFESGVWGFRAADDLEELATEAPEVEPEAAEAFIEEAIAEREDEEEFEEIREFDERLAEQIGLDLRPGEAVLFQDLPGIGRSTQEAIEDATGLSAVFNARTAFEMRDERDAWDDLLDVLPDDEARRTLVEAIGEDPDEVLARPEGEGLVDFEEPEPGVAVDVTAPPEEQPEGIVVEEEIDVLAMAEEEGEEPEGERVPIVVDRIAGNLAYSVQGTVPGSVTVEAINAAMDEFGSADAFEETNTVGHITFADSTVTDIDLQPGRDLLAEEEPEVEAEPERAFTPGQVETIIEGATEGLAVNAIVFDDTITRIELDPDFDSPAIDPGASAGRVNVTDAQDLRGAIDRAVTQWEQMVVEDLPDEVALDVNDRRTALNAQFNLELPLFDVEPPSGFSAADIEDIVTRSIAGAEVMVRVNRAANSLRIAIEPVTTGDIRYQRSPDEVQGQPDMPQVAIIEAIQEWEDAVDFRTVTTSVVNNRREAVALDFDITIPEMGEVGEPGEELPERGGLLEKWETVTEGLSLTDIDEDVLIEQPGLDLPVEVEQEVAGMIEGATRAEFEAEQFIAEGELAEAVRRAREMEGVRQVESGLQIHHTEDVHDQVHAIIAEMLDAEPENFWDSSKPSDQAGYDLFYEFTLSRNRDDQPWRVPRFLPSDLFEKLQRIDSDRIKVIALAAPLA